MVKEVEDKKRRKLKQTVRQRTEQTVGAKPKTRRLRSTAKSVAKPFKIAHSFGKREYYLPLPNNKLGTFLNKRRHVIPRYFREAFSELKGVTWPNRKETAQLTIAVFMFAIIFGILITVTDYGLDKIFRRILLK